jgi:prepilin-type N-terminal cleavage/methylation domain-containing protein
MKTRTQQGFTLIELLVVITIIAILASLAVPTFSKIQEKGNQTKGISNCRQIITAMRIFASDNNGNYPGSSTSGGTAASDSNTAFQELFTGGVLNNENIFGCPNSKDGNPDGKIGTAPQYSDALKENENHWALTLDQTDSSSGSMPLVFEAPKGATWDPSWDVSAGAGNKPGRAWSGAKVIIGSNDSSVALLKLEAGGKLAGNQNATGSKLAADDNLFAQNKGDTEPKIANPKGGS